MVNYSFTKRILSVRLWLIVKKNPNGEIGKHNKLKICRQSALKVQVLFRILKLCI
jgi:hypothetical protein